MFNNVVTFGQIIFKNNSVLAVSPQRGQAEGRKINCKGAGGEGKICESAKGKNTFDFKGANSP